jgi:hypothetical protein
MNAAAQRADSRERYVSFATVACGFDMTTSTPQTTSRGLKDFSEALAEKANVHPLQDKGGAVATRRPTMTPAKSTSVLPSLRNDIPAFIRIAMTWIRTAVILARAGCDCERFSMIARRVIA